MLSTIYVELSCPKNTSAHEGSGFPVNLVSKKGKKVLTARSVQF